MKYLVLPGQNMKTVFAKLLGPFAQCFLVYQAWYLQNIMMKKELNYLNKDRELEHQENN
jgi:hypothetical protein